METMYGNRKEITLEDEFMGKSSEKKELSWRGKWLSSMIRIVYLAAIAFVVVFHSSAFGNVASAKIPSATPESYFTIDVNGEITGYDPNGPDDDIVILDVIIPNTINHISVKSIGSKAFYSQGLTSVVIPYGVTSIGLQAFALNHLKEVSIPGSVTSVEEGAFVYNQLQTVSLESGLTNIGPVAFAENQLTEVNIPSGVSNIGILAFANNQLTKATIPGSVTSIGDQAFSNNLLNDVTIENGVTSIGNSAFSNNQLTEISIPDSVSNIGSSAFTKNKLVEVSIPFGVITIQRDSFSNNELTSVSIPESVKTIEKSAFENNHLTNVVIPNPNVLLGSLGSPSPFANNQSPSSAFIMYGFDPSTAKGHAQKYGFTFVNKFPLITFKETDGTVLLQKYAEAGNTLGAHLLPTKTGYAISGLYKDAESTLPWNLAEDILPAENFTLYVKWIKQHTVIFQDEHGNALGTVIVNDGGGVKAPEKEGYTFICNTDLTNVTADLIVTGRFQVNQYTVRFESEQGGAGDEITVDYGTKLTSPSEPQRPGYLFRGWYKDDALTEPWDFDNDTVPAKNISLYAKWIKQHTVLFKDENGNTVGTIIVNDGDDAKAPEKEGYTFICNVDLTNVTADLTVIGHFQENQYTVRIESYRGGPIEEVVADYGTKLTSPLAPKRPGYLFLGWYKDQALTEPWDFDNDTVPAKNMTLYAKWKYIPPAYYPVEKVELDQTTVTLDLDGRSVALKPVFTPTYATNQAVMWSSSNPEVATVDENGVVTPISAGETTIVVTTQDGNKTAECRVLVQSKEQPAKLVSLRATERNMLVRPGKSVKFDVYAVFSDGHEEKITLDDKTTYKSSSSSKVAVKPGVITAGSKEGKGTITIRYGGKRLTLPVTISRTYVKQLVCEEKNVTLTKGESKQLTLTALFSDKKSKDVAQLALWSSADPHIVSVTDGKLVAHKSGTTKITARYGGKTVILKVEVTE